MHGDIDPSRVPGAILNSADSVSPDYRYYDQYGYDAQLPQLIRRNGSGTLSKNLL